VQVTAYSDSNYATDIDDRKSISGKMIFVGRSPAMFSTSRQTTLATSSAEAELPRS
jgi:lipopolysaccharide assembly outer membrane protein LptD (OstA)